MNPTLLLHGLCAGLYAALSALILIQARLSRTGLFLAGAALLTAAWAGAVALSAGWPATLALDSAAGALDLLRSAGWYAFILHLYRRTLPARNELTHAFVVMGLVGLLVIGISLLLGPGAAGGGGVSLWSMSTGLRLGLAVCNILLIENLYRNASKDAKWFVNLPCMALGGLFVYDIVLSADAVLFRQLSPVLFDGRAVATAIVAPLLAVAAARNRSWSIDIHVSRTAVFHSATLVGSGIFLLGLAAAGETFRFLGASWGGVAEISLLFSGVLLIAMVVTSQTARSRIRGVVIDHFFSHRYDYRREWMRSITTLSSADAYVALHTRVIRTVAEVLDSAGGALFLDESAAGSAAVSFQWAGSWNMPAATTPIMGDHPLAEALRGGGWIVELPGSEAGQALPLEFADAWLAVPLSHGGRMIGFILVAKPRAGFKLDREVFDLLRILGQQVATYVAEQRATQIMLQAQQLHDYGKRFAFVAHDIKNVSSQLSLLLSNAEIHLSNPEFQRDMLATVRASVAKIGALLKRLQAPASPVTRSVIRPTERLEAVVGSIGRLRGVAVALDMDGREAGIAMSVAAFDAMITHLLNNAIEATQEADGDGVRVQVRHEARRMLIDIIDQGPGMTAEFIRDKLFRPFDTSKSGGSGIGAFQARELLREMGGDLVVISRPGAGTTMRVLLPLVEAAVGPATAGAG
ncbi:MAG TPA: XrtA/PEP-CTERM system histidine kinase PrsK [Acetobacteraceae bacterium]